MLVWLSSYPRSGNTFVRILLSQVFGLGAFSLHGDNDPQSFGSPALTELVGHRTGGSSKDRIISEAQRSAELNIVKTHEHPLTDDPCIFIVRDGRSSVVSYWHFLREIAGIDIALEQVVCGNCFAGSWSDHYVAWQPKLRPHTLLLRYEEIVKDPGRTVAALSDFLRIQPHKNFDLTFEGLKGLNPKFFRSGSDQNNIAELAEHADLFWTHHGHVMGDLLYGS
ncbi:MULTISPECIES: sulfotransferase domain-containing protein [Burkholderia]|uniref:sulfotransferase domain-containing protein n=1 Tax=Burkholderia TaxID=32008 RepID=UPI000931A417|nr:MULTISPECIES: sulfotransferase domain-containing protein [Burkholderia]